MDKKTKELKEKKFSDLQNKINKEKSKKTEEDPKENRKESKPKTEKARKETSTKEKDSVDQTQNTIKLPEKNKKKDLELKSYHLKKEYIEKIDRISDNTDYYKYELVNMALGMFFDKLEDNYQ